MPHSENAIHRTTDSSLVPRGPRKTIQLPCFDRLAHSAATSKISRPLFSYTYALRYQVTPLAAHSCEKCRVSGLQNTTPYKKRTYGLRPLACSGFVPPPHGAAMPYPPVRPCPDPAWQFADSSDENHSLPSSSGEYAFRFSTGIGTEPSVSATLGVNKYGERK